MEEQVQGPIFGAPNTDITRPFSNPNVVQGISGLLNTAQVAQAAALTFNTTSMVGAAALASVMMAGVQADMDAQVKTENIADQSRQDQGRRTEGSEDWTLTPHLTQGSPEQKLPALNALNTGTVARKDSGESSLHLPSFKHLMEVASQSNDAAVRDQTFQRTSSYQTAAGMSPQYLNSPNIPHLASSARSSASRQPSYRSATDDYPSTNSLSSHANSLSLNPPAESSLLQSRAPQSLQVRPSLPLLHSTSSGSIGSHYTETTASIDTAEGYSPSSGSVNTDGQHSGSPNQVHPSQAVGYHDYPSFPVAGGYKCKHEGCTAAPFQTQYLLNSHRNVHSSERPHYCPVAGCKRAEGGRGFKRKNEMIRHGLVHNSPGYICPYCPDRVHTYPRPDNLQRHVHLHHKDKNKDDPILRGVLAQRPMGIGSNPNRRRRV